MLNTIVTRTKKRVKTSKGRKISSTIWLQRHINDPYVGLANKLGYRSRAALKLVEMEEKFGFLKKSHECIIDLGSAPGSWLQVIKQNTKLQTLVIGVEIKKMKPIPGTIIIEGDFTNKSTIENIEKTINNHNHHHKETIAKLKEGMPIVDCILSDMAPDACGDKDTDHTRITRLIEEAIIFTQHHLKPGGAFITKLFNGNKQSYLLAKLKEIFTKVEIFKPKASYKNSSEIFLIGLERK